MNDLIEYPLVGGPFDGQRVRTDGSRILRLAIRQPVSVVAWPERDLTLDYAEYERFGSRYWWEGLVKDARCDVDVSDEAWVKGGADLRREVRGMVRRALEDLADGKELSRIVWRLLPNRKAGTTTVRGLVGPRAPEFRRNQE